LNYSVSIDTVYINVKYPSVDVFSRWFPIIKEIEPRILKAGIPISDFLVKGGAGGYRVSVWSHGIRAFLTDRVDEVIGDGYGMGVWVQIGPKFLLDHPPGVGLRDAVKDFLFRIGVEGDWPISITRIDLALDLFGIELDDQNVEIWRKGWVGRSGISSTYFNTSSGKLETINVGSRRSAVFLRIYDKVAQAESEGDIDYWRDVWDGHSGPVTRIEWEVKPKLGGFVELQDFFRLCEFQVVKLLNYLVEWGRFCIPNPDDSNNRRWEISDFWKIVLSVAKDWADEITWPTSRMGKQFKGISEKYLRSVAGNFSGAMARLNPESPSLFSMLKEMEDWGLGLKKIQYDAENKAEVYKRS
jgi:hypothetical protein